MATLTTAEPYFGKVGMAVTQRRICEWGFGMIGVCVEGHLRPAHNKREYLSQA